MANEGTSTNQLDNFIYHYTTNISQLEEDNRVLRETVNRLKQEVEKFKRTPLMICEIRDIINNHAIINIPNGNQFYVEISGEMTDLKAGDSVLVEQKNLTIVEKIVSTKKFGVEKFVIVEKPNMPWESVGGLAAQVEEIKEVIELPLRKPALFKKMGIMPPKGILLHGPPGTGKTLLAKAVATSTDSTFIEVVGSELVQKFIGEGAKLVKEIFEMARERAPSIVFIDEIDALASRRMDVGTSGEREVQRTFMQLLAEIDGFKHLSNVKIIGCTNRKDILDPAILRPGRLDRLIEIPNPDKKGMDDIFKIHSKGMPLQDTFVLSDLVGKKDSFSGADVKAICTEAGYFAIRENKNKVSKEHVLKAITKVRARIERETEEHLQMFG